MSKDEKILLALSLIEQLRADADEVAGSHPEVAQRIMANTSLIEGLVTGDYSKLPLAEKSEIASGE